MHETSGNWPLGSKERPLRVAVIGSGPSGFYAIAALFKADGLEADVDLFDRLPTPFGLVRGGVAPDHQKIKNVIRGYNRTAQHDRFRFFGNVELGRDISVEDL
ncbi:MAG: NADP oxidoreductase, partial [Holophagales bacterium]|nr:NADP oxidoreductase [Holophagales bacterium]